MAVQPPSAVSILWVKGLRGREAKQWRQGSAGRRAMEQGPRILGRLEVRGNRQTKASKMGGVGAVSWELRSKWANGPKRTRTGQFKGSGVGSEERVSRDAVELLRSILALGGTFFEAFLGYL
mmetsp:Transcript_26677/g.41756  ORF Transcript_26677/g.41756 Transcript_26677/m.41756 type:complete len:122 (+) Transcript_26677:1072-1437(+)